jgi:hypothetical protein
MNIQRASSGRHSNTCFVANRVQGGRNSLVAFSASARAVRPLAASAPTRWLVASTSLYAEPALGQRENGFVASHSFLGHAQKSMFGKAQIGLWQVTARSEPMQALRSRAKPKTVGAATSFARGGGFGLLASGATQRTMHAGSVPQNALPNPSIERTSPGKPGAASHLKR